LCGALAESGETLELAVVPGAREEPEPEPEPEPQPEPAPGPEPQPAPGPKPPSFAQRHRQAQLDTWRVTRIPVLVILGYFTLSHLALGSKWVFVDNVNLLLHEGGHKIWGWDGRTLAALGGTLGQLMFPALFAVYFFAWQKERFAAVTCVWWFGENFIGIARYMDDAVPMELPLVGGPVHDWNYLFGKWGYLSKANEIAGFFHWLGVLTMIGTLGALVYWTARPRDDEIDFAE
jgi:hypothetical protein